KRSRRDPRTGAWPRFLRARLTWRTRRWAAAGDARTFHPEPIMRPCFLFAVFLAPAAATPALFTACVAATPVLAAGPPAWLLLAAALLLLGAGRLAAT